MCVAVAWLPSPPAPSGIPSALAGLRPLHSPDDRILHDIIDTHTHTLTHITARLATRTHGHMPHLHAPSGHPPVPASHPPP